MKRTLLMVTGFCICFLSCTNDKNLLGEVNLPSNEGSMCSTKRAEVVFFQNKMLKQTGCIERFRNLLKDKTALYEYMKISNTQDYGLHFWIPICDKEGLVEGAIIYPVDEKKSGEEQSINGDLGTPIILNKEVINNVIPQSRKYLYSWMFRELEDIGLNVISDLSDEAIRLEREKKENINTRSSSNPQVVGGNITLHYQISSSGFVDPNGQPVIVTLSKNSGALCYNAA